MCSNILAVVNAVALTVPLQAANTPQGSAEFHTVRDETVFYSAVGVPQSTTDVGDNKTGLSVPDKSQFKTGDQTAAGNLQFKNGSHSVVNNSQLKTDAAGNLQSKKGIKSKGNQRTTNQLTRTNSIGGNNTVEQRTENVSGTSKTVGTPKQQGNQTESKRPPPAYKPNGNQGTNYQSRKGTVEQRTKNDCGTSTSRNGTGKPSTKENVGGTSTAAKHRTNVDRKNTVEQRPENVGGTSTSGEVSDFPRTKALQADNRQSTTVYHSLADNPQSKTDAAKNRYYDASIPEAIRQDAAAEVEEAFQKSEKTVAAEKAAAAKNYRKFAVQQARALNLHDELRTCYALRFSKGGAEETQKLTVDQQTRAPRDGQPRPEGSFRITRASQVAHRRPVPKNLKKAKAMVLKMAQNLDKKMAKKTAKEKTLALEEVEGRSKCFPKKVIAELFDEHFVLDSDGRYVRKPGPMRFPSKDPEVIAKKCGDIRELLNMRPVIEKRISELRESGVDAKKEAKLAELEEDLKIAQESYKLLDELKSTVSKSAVYRLTNDEITELDISLEMMYEMWKEDEFVRTEVEEMQERLWASVDKRVKLKEYCEANKCEAEDSEAENSEPANSEAED